LRIFRPVEERVKARETRRWLVSSALSVCLFFSQEYVLFGSRQGEEALLESMSEEDEGEEAVAKVR
jgi:hypothetical protein